MPTNHTKLEEIENHGPLALSPGRKRRTIKLTKQDRLKLINSEMIEKAAAMFLDLETIRSWSQIARELGISVATLQELTKTEEFDRVYNAMFVELGHDPRYRAVQAELGDMLPLTIKVMRELLATASPNIKLKAIELIWKITNMSVDASSKSDRKELAEFLKNNNISIENINMLVQDGSHYLGYDK